MLTDPTMTVAPPRTDAPLITAPIPRDLIPSFDQCAFLLDIDGTLLDMAAKPRDVIVPPGLRESLTELLARTNGALAMVSGRSLEDIDFIFGPEFPAVGGHGAEMRISATSTTVVTHAPPMDISLKRRFAKLAEMSDGILLEDKGYSLALHFRLAPECEEAIYDGVSAIRADLPNAPIEVLPGKFVCEIKHSGFTKATGVTELMTHQPFKGRRPIFLGDDVTDESVFAIMPDMKGLAFSVGRRAQGVNGHFDEPENVRQWLASLLKPI
ncbi:MAG: trehalose-phosphatase [Tardiphaga sp.]|nr:trehalose-phosphatase [Tardiphaga sp.]MDB5625347.1 trehalose-phosphatase [Tardiphaga sp.]